MNIDMWQTININMEQQLYKTSVHGSMNQYNVIESTASIKMYK